MNHFLASYTDALSRSSSGVLIEKDNDLYYALPTLDVQVINSWIHLQKSIFPNLRICGIYSMDAVNILDYEFCVLDKCYYIQYDTIYNVQWLDTQLKDLGYYTVEISKFSLVKSIKEFHYQDFDLSNLNAAQIISDLDNLDLKKNGRFLLNVLSKVDLHDGNLKQVHNLVHNIIKQIRIQGSKSF